MTVRLATNCNCFHRSAASHRPRLTAPTCVPSLSGDYAGMYYGADHPMKPPRIAMTHHLVLGYGLHEKMDVYVS